MNTLTFKQLRFLIPVLIFFNLSSCEQFPKDVENTLEKIQNDTLIVGVTENPPFVKFDGDSVSGKEVEMIKALALQLNAEIDWIKGSEETIIGLLKEGQVHIAAGGFVKSSVWKKHVYLSRPHDTIIYTWGVPMGSSLPQSIEDKNVIAKKGSIASAIAQKETGNVITKDSLTGEEPLIAAPKKELEALNYSISEDELKKEKISLALRKGENAFVEVVDKFIKSYERKDKK